MTSLLGAGLALLMALSPLTVRADPQGAAQATASDPEAKYQALLAAAKAGAGPIDWQALRYAEADRPGFVPDKVEPDRGALFKAINAKDWSAARDLAGRVIDAEYTDSIAHLALAVADHNLGDDTNGVREHSIGQGLLASIRTGDGKSFGTAFTVIAVREEYDLMTAMQLKLVSQSLNMHDGHQYDVMSTTDQAGAAATYYFQIDREWAAENRMFRRH